MKARLELQLEKKLKDRLIAASIKTGEGLSTIVRDAIKKEIKRIESE